MLDLYKELETKDAYSIKKGFIEKWAKEGKNPFEIQNEWLRILNQYVLKKEEYDFNLHPYKGDYRHCSYYISIDLVGELTFRGYKPEIFKNMVMEKKRHRKLEIPQGVVIYEVLEILTGTMYRITLKHETYGLNRQKTYTKIPKREDVLADFMFFLDDAYIPQGELSTFYSIYDGDGFERSYEGDFDFDISKWRLQND